jgi:raffinose/stachyose/melibiose transport system permease protein
MAGLMNIPDSVYEAYRLESRSILRRIWDLDVPLVGGQTRLLVVLTFIGSLQDFQSVLILTGGGPGLATMVPALRMYHAAFRFNHFGYGAALGVVLFLMILVITAINLRVGRRGEA